MSIELHSMVVSTTACLLRLRHTVACDNDVRSSFWHAPLSILLTVMMVAGVANISKVNALTPADTIINNQATATYRDSQSVVRGVSSNTVETVVQQVAGLTLTVDQNKPATEGAVIDFPHLITNTGNGSDRYTLTASDQNGSAGVDFSFTTVQIFADEDSNGFPDSASPITQTRILAPGESYAVVVRAQVPLSVNVGDTGRAALNASSQFTSSVTATNLDNVEITDRAIIEVTKFLSQNEGESGSGPYQVTLIYNNPSSRIARELIIRDVLPNFMNYGGNARWSIGNLSLTDANTEVQAQNPSIRFCAYDPSCTGGEFLPDQLTLIIDEVGAGQSGTITFNVTIDPAAIPGTIFNRANFRYNDTVAVTAYADSNRVPFTIQPSALVNFAGDTIANASPGQTIVFDNVLSNSGNAVDVFNISLDRANSNFPNGVFFQLLQEDGATPMKDSNGDGIVDTGPMNPGDLRTIKLQVLLPPDITPSTYNIDKLAASLNDSSVVASATDTVTVTLAPGTVDVTNNFPAGNVACDEIADSCGFGAGPEANPQNNVQITPGGTAVFVLYISNSSAIDDTYELAASSDATFATQQLPTNWSVIFINDDGVPVSSAGPLTPGSNIRIRALVTVPADASANDSSVFFQAKSALTGVSDSKHDEVTVQEKIDLELVPSQTGQTVPASWINYRHELTNNGNTAITNIGLVTSNTQTGQGWVSIVYDDTNGDKNYDANDQQITTIASLAPGETRTLFVRVFAPGSAPAGIDNTTTLSASYNNGASSLTVDDVTTINPFNVDIVKEQALDANCDGTPDNAYTLNPFQVPPGQCIIYKLSTQNNSAEPVFNTEIVDATPGFTSYSNAQPVPRCVPAVCTIATEPASGGSGVIQVSAGNLSAGNIVEFYFSVQVDGS